MSVGVPVEGEGIDAADEVGTGSHGLVQQFGRAFLTEHTGLREGNDLHAEEIRKLLTYLEQRIQMGEAQVRGDIDVCSNRRRPVSDALADQVGRAFGHRRQGTANPRFGVDAALAVGTCGMRHPG